MVQVICVGLGNRGKRWVRWAQKAGADVIGVVDAHDETLTRHGAELGFSEQQRFTSISEAAKQLKPEAAVVCTPNHIHEQNGRECLENGLHLFIEKPLTEHMSTARALVDMADERGLQLAVAQQYRYEPPMRRLRDIVRGGDIGVATNGLVEFYRWRPTEGMKLPLLLNQSVHHFDAMRVIYGSTPIACVADMWDPEWNGCDGPTVVEATFRFENGARVHYSGSYVAKGKMSSYNALWRLEGSEGQVVYDGNDRVALSRSDEEDPRVEQLSGDRQSSITAVCADFLQAVRTGSPSPTSGRDNLGTLAMVFAIEKSAAERREVAMEEILHPKA